MPDNNLKLANEFAKDYDIAIAKNNWKEPQILYYNTVNLLQPNAQILDLGIGTGESSRPFQNAGHIITGIDGSAKMLEECKKKKIGEKLIQHNLEEVPFPLINRSFDLVISHAVFHLTHPIKLIFKEVHRILKPGGLFVFTFEKWNSNSGYKELEAGVWSKKTESGVETFKHSENYISELLIENQFKSEFEKEYLAFTNIELNQEFYFTVNVARFQPE